MVRPVKSSAFSRMVSGPVLGVPRARLGNVVRAFSKLLVLPSLACLSFFGGCAKSECLRDDCRTSAPDEAGASAGSAPRPDAGAPGVLPSRSCTANSECPEDQGQSCVNGSCRLSCTSHFDCLGLGECASALNANGEAGHFCDPTRPQKIGQFYTHCPRGNECDSAHAFFCVGAGADDLDAYCTTDCTDDAACAPGYACTPLTRSPCQDICNLKGNPKDRQCVPSDQIGTGKPFQCGSRGVTRNACRPRRFCSPCANDDDCLAVANQVCAKDESGTKTCTQLCDLKNPSCPWGTAAKCGVWDTDLKRATCAHRFGRCTGSGKSCEPCLKDADCGAQGACTTSSFTGERWCVDFRVSCSCGSAADSSGVCSGGGCPETPGGLRMQCSDQTPSMADSGVCVGAYTSSALGSSPQTGCWPAN